MTTAADFGPFVLDVAPLGGMVEPCSPDGTPQVCSGSFTAPGTVIEVADAEHDAMVQVRFSAAGPSEPGSALTIYTTDPWTQLPDGRWLLPSLTPDGELVRWLALTPYGGL